MVGTEICLDDDLGTDEVEHLHAQIPHHSLLKIYVMFTLMFQTIFHLSDTGVNVLFSFLAIFMGLVASKIGSDIFLEFCQYRTFGLPES